MSGMNLGPTLGAMLIGNLVSTALYGIVSMQTIMYLSAFVREDDWQLVGTACFLWLLETAHMFFVGNYLYHNLLMNYCDPPLSTTKVDDATTAVVALITFIVHCFYTRRIWILSRKNMWLTGIIGLLAVVHFGLELAVTGLTYKFPRYDQLHIMEGYFNAALALAAVLDILIAGMLVYLLNQKRSGIKSTETRLKKIAAYAVSSGALTSITDVIVLVCYVAMPKNLVYLGFYSCTCDLYTLSLLTSLNARGSLRNIHTDVNSIRLQSHPLSDFRTSGAIEFSTGAASGKSVSPMVHVSRTTTVQDDKYRNLYVVSE